jgi:type I restriction-modification system DNA methylase subunit
MYNCELCNKVFQQKIDFTRHANKKSPCISIDKMQSLAQSRGANSDHKTNLKKIFDYCVDVLRNNEHLTGDKALRALAYLLDLRLLESQFENQQIDIDTYEYDFSAYDDSIIEQHKTKLLKFVRFSNLAKEDEDNIPGIMKCLWDEILSEHPVTKNIFSKGKGFDIQHQSTYKKLIDKLYTFDFEGIDEDILGEAYEEVIKDVMIGKTLGQYFTPPKVKQMMVNLIEPEIHADGKIETIFDPAMGTGGFLISCLRSIIKRAKVKGIQLDWDFVSSTGLGGREAEPDTYQLAVSNMLIASGKMFKVLEKGDSIRDPITNKYDIIVANPPYGIDGLNYAEILHPLRNEYMPIKSNSAVTLFLQAIIHILKIGGRCAVVLPDGKELFSKTSTELIAVRQYLMKTCDLKEVIYLPAGTFTHTSIKTCVFYFYKKKEGKDVLDTKIKHSKTTNKETDRTYEFSKTHQTSTVKFYEYNTENETKNMLLEVEIDQIAKNSYSLNYTEYVKDDTEQPGCDEGVVIKNLGDICQFQAKSKRKASYGQATGEYPFYTSSQTCSKRCTEYDYEDECLIIGTGGTANVKHSSKFSCSADNYVIKINGDISTKYVYYYLLVHVDLLQQGFVGVAIQHISKDFIGGVNIPIPSADRQREIVACLDFIFEKSYKTSMEKIDELKQLNAFCVKTTENETKTIGTICKFLPKSKRQASYGEATGEYPFYTSSQTCSKHCVEFDYEDECLIIGTGGTANVKHSSKFSCSTDNAILKFDESVCTKYVYYYLLNNIELLQHGFVGVGLQHISKDYMTQVKIELPPIERQREIVDYCEKNDELIHRLEGEIENNQRLAARYV